VIDYSADLAATFREIFRCLKHGGRILIADLVTRRALRSQPNIRVLNRSKQSQQRQKQRSVLSVIGRDRRWTDKKLAEFEVFGRKIGGRKMFIGLSRFLLNLPANNLPAALL